MTPASHLPVAISDCHQLLAWIIPHLDTFPRIRRYTLGERLEQTLLVVLEQLLEAAYQRPSHKVEGLQLANRKLAVARHLWRLGYELKACSFRTYHHGAELMVGVGRQIGGWQRHMGDRKKPHV